MTLKSGYDKKLRIIQMLKKHPKARTDIKYLVTLADRWQYQTDEIKLERLRKVRKRIANIPHKIIDNLLHNTYNKEKFVIELLFVNLDILIEIAESFNDLNYWKTDVEKLENKQKIKDLIDSIKSFIPTRG